MLSFQALMSKFIMDVIIAYLKLVELYDSNLKSSVYRLVVIIVLDKWLFIFAMYYSN